MEKRMIDKSICQINFSNASFADEKGTSDCLNVIKYFTNQKDYFFHFHRESGNFDTEEEVIKYREKIPGYIKANGIFVEKTLEKFKEKKNFDPRIAGIGRLPISEDTYNMIPNICNYYLETVFFEPSSDYLWEMFENEYDNYNTKSAEFFIKKGYTDYVIAYCDTGTFFVLVNTEKYDMEEIDCSLKKLL